MIIGNGMLAKKFIKYKNSNNVLIFASGVSNSLESDSKEFAREFELIRNSIPIDSEMLFVYFSTCSMYDPVAKNSKYVKHKTEIEDYIRNNAKKFCIFRVSQIVGVTNNDATLISFFKKNIINSNYFEVWQKANRNIIDIDDVYTICDYIIKNEKDLNKIIHVANKNYITAMEIVNIISEITKKNANYNIINKGKEYMEIPHEIDVYLKKLKINFSNNYCRRILEKYI